MEAQSSSVKLQPIDREIEKLLKSGEKTVRELQDATGETRDRVRSSLGRLEKSPAGVAKVAGSSPAAYFAPLAEIERVVANGGAKPKKERAKKAKKTKAPAKPRERKKGFTLDDGTYVASERVARSSGATIRLIDGRTSPAYRGDEALRWVVECVDHGQIERGPVRRTMRHVASTPEEFCPECKKASLTRAEDVKRERAERLKAKRAEKRAEKPAAAPKKAAAAKRTVASKSAKKPAAKKPARKRGAEKRAEQQRRTGAALAPGAPDLAQFVSDYLAIDGSASDSNHDIAMAYADQAYAGESDVELDLWVSQIEAQVAYYR